MKKSIIEVNWKRNMCTNHQQTAMKGNRKPIVINNPSLDIKNHNPSLNKFTLLQRTGVSYGWYTFHLNADFGG